MMAEKEQQSPYPMAPAAILGHPRSDAESGTELRQKKRNKLILYIVLFAVFQIVVILIFSLTVMKIRTPEFRVSAAVITNIPAGMLANSSFSATLNADVTVRNNNFGRYKYQNTTVEFMYGGAPAGQAILRSSRVNMRSTKKIEITVDLNLAASSQLASDLSGGVLTLSSSGKMMGKVELFGVTKKKRSTAMDCSMEIVLATQHIRIIACK